MNATMEQTRTYTPDEQIDSLRRITENNPFVAQRRLARGVWNAANGRNVIESGDLASEKERFTSDSFLRDAAALKGVPLATVYNRIRRILGLIH